MIIIQFLIFFKLIYAYLILTWITILIWNITTKLLYYECTSMNTVRPDVGIQKRFYHEIGQEVLLKSIILIEWNNIQAFNKYQLAQTCTKTILYRQISKSKKKTWLTNKHKAICVKLRLLWWRDLHLHLVATQKVLLLPVQTR